MRNIFSSLLVLILSQWCECREKIVMLTALTIPQSYWDFRDPLRTEKWSELEKYFFQHFTSVSDRFDLLIYHQADLDQLWRVLQDPEVSAIIWISHSASARDQAAGFQFDSVLQTEAGRNLLPLFQKPHAQLKFLGVVGCRGLSALKAFQEKYYRKANPSLVLKAFDEKTELMAGVAETFDQALKVLQEPVAPLILPRKNPRHRITIRRTWMPSEGNLSLDSAMVLLNGELIGLLPVLRAGESQLIDFAVDLESNSANSYTLKIDTGYLQKVKNRTIPLGEIEIQETEPPEGTAPREWKAFRDSLQKKISVGYELYLRS